jgi:hypothetical protein
MAVHNVLASVGAFIGLAIGVYVAGHLPAQDITLAGISLRWKVTLLAVFEASAIARLMVAGVFLPRLREVRQVQALSISGLIFRVTRFHALSGLMFDIVGTHDDAGKRGPLVR